MVLVFGIGDYVICGNKGVCTVENITTLNISGVDKDKMYYILKPVYTSGSTVYVPVDSSGESMRRVLEPDEAKKLIGMMPGIPPLMITEEKLSEQMYRECIRTNDCKELVKIIKTIYGRKKKRIQAGRKVTAVDEKYCHLAEDHLYGELAVVLDMDRKEVGEYISEVINGREVMA